MSEKLQMLQYLKIPLSYLVKSGPFHEHSNQLWNISAVPLWSKVYSGETNALKICCAVEPGLLRTQFYVLLGNSKIQRII